MPDAIPDATPDVMPDATPDATPADMPEAMPGNVPLGAAPAGRSYHKLSAELIARIEADRAAHWVNPWRAEEADILRRDPSRDRATLWRPAYVRDIEKILHSPWYNRYTDKTQVFSLYRNDDLTRRALHVQIVS
ncbi:MAG: hypothetical protein LBR39_05130, partial [Coriobacteriales bacterium]|nr:hypothetical protein [Coriobacteriales bacterium]